MKVVKSKTPKEEVKFTNVFGEEYAPEEFEFICDDCLAEEVDFLKNDVLGLAEDILDHEDVLHMLGEKLQTIEDNQLTDIANLSDAIEVMDCMQKANHMMLDIIVEQNEEIKEFESKHNNLARLMCFILIWTAILSVLFGVYVF